MILRGSNGEGELKTIKGELQQFEIITIPAERRNIDILTFKISGYNDKTALYLNNRKDYVPLIDKFKSRHPIEISYNDKGGVAADGFNLHIHKIKYGNEKLIDFDKITSTDKRVGKILYFIGLIFLLSIIYVYRQQKKDR